MTYTKSEPKSSDSINIGGSADFNLLPAVIGIPPSTGSGITATENMLNNSFLTIDITPCKPKFQEGISLFSLDATGGWNEYIKLLKAHEFTVSSESNLKKSIRIAAIAEGFPTDTFANEYGEHFLNKLTDVAGSAMGELAQMTASNNATDTAVNLGQALKNQDGVLGMIGSGALAGAEALKSFVTSGKGQPGIVGSMATMADKLLAGARIDFPMVWKNSSYNGAFSFNIKLYNPSPASDELTNKYIIGPLAALLLLALPQSSDDGSSYNYPFFCKVNCPGLFKIQSGAITSISVNKGGESGSVAFNQRPGIIDVRMDFINLHNSMIASSSYSNSSRPTLKNYLENMKDSMELKNIYNAGASVFPDNFESSILNKQSVTENLSDSSELPPERVSPDAIEMEERLGFR